MMSFKQFLNKKIETPKEISKKSDVSIKKIKSELKKGISTEKEHTTKKDVAKQIALAHMGEDPKYYDKLKKMEKKK